MFEKEALVYATVSLPDGYTKIDYQKKTDWQKGAEFGYNKAKEEMIQNGLALQSDMDKTIEQNIALKKELEKANEWHYVKDELPDEGTYLVVWQNDKGYKEIFILKYEEDDEGELHWVDDDYEVQDEYVIAWKEIVLPELKEKEQ